MKRFIIVYILFILLPGGLLCFICINLITPKVYIWVAILLIAIIIMTTTVVFVITRRRMKLSEQKSDLVSNISHELRTPLTAINMFTQMLISNIYESSAEKQEYLNIIQEECNRLIDLIDKVLDFSRIEKRRNELYLEQESINDVILYAVQIFKTQQIENSCEITVNLANDLPKIFVDKDAITTVLLNLLSNAEKYSTGEKKIIINSEMIKNYIAIEIIDNGIGIHPKYHKKIFKPFYRVNDPLSKDIKGIGLGLAYVKHIVTGHKGKIKVQSEIGHGSKFTILLPCFKRGAKWLKF